MSTRFKLTIIYIGTAMRYSWFWLGTWVIYYKSFGGYAAVGLLETIMVSTQIVFEIPTGAIGDIIGKKKSVVIGNFINGIANIWMGIAPNLVQMCLSLFFMCIGSTFHSGSFEALVYEILEEDNRVDEYKKIMNNITVVSLITMVIAGILGGYMNNIYPGLPYLANGIFLVIGSLLIFTIQHDDHKNETSNISQYFRQSLSGFKNLFANIEISKLSIQLLFISLVVIIVYEGLNDILLIEYGFSAIEMGYITAIGCLVAAAIVHLASRNTTHKNRAGLYGFLYGITLLPGNFLTGIYGIISSPIRFALAPLIDNEILQILNDKTKTDQRATTISTFSVLKRIPYALILYPLTSLFGIISPYTVGVILGLVAMITGISLIGTKVDK